MVYLIVKFNKKFWLKLYLDINTELRKKAQNVTKHRDIKLVTSKPRKNYLASEANYHTRNVFLQDLLAIEMTKTQIFTNNSVYLSILEISKIVMYKFWYDCMKQKWGEKAKLCDMGTDSFTVYIKTEGIYIDVVKDVETRFDTSNYKLDRPLPKGKNYNVLD